ncbi:MAG: nucleotidyltransferase family protein [archaeon]|nr:nucleotidyltransferase family protein [archaeon]
MTFKAIIPCAGKGTRLRPYTEETPKALIPLGGEPLLNRILDKALMLGVVEIIIIVNWMKEKIINSFGDNYKDIPIRYVVQEELHGLAHAIGKAEEFIDDNFIVLLGDEIYKETNHKDLKNFIEKNKPDCICGIMAEENEEIIKGNYTVKFNGEPKIISEIIEKPKEVFNHFIGIGTWYFNKKVFKYIKKTPPSNLRNEIELANVIQNMINAGETAMAFLFNGSYINVNRFEDLKQIKKLLKI